MFPPFTLIARVVRKLHLQPAARILLVAPLWPSQSNPVSDENPSGLSSENLLKNLVMGMYYLKPDTLKLTAWPLSADHLLVEGFQQWLLTWFPDPNQNQLR